MIVLVVICALLVIELARWKLRPEARRLRVIRKISKISKSPLIVIGTSGSLDYLVDDSTKRYWPVKIPSLTKPKEIV
jgi:hypothetical protein